MPNKTISVPDDVLPIIEGLEIPFSSWVTNQLRHHAATAVSMSFGQQLLADADLSNPGLSNPDLSNVDRPTEAESLEVAKRMERSAPW